jgi:hemolysin activation/secretion protein
MPGPPLTKNKQPAPWRRARRFLLSFLIGWQSVCLAQAPPTPVQFEVKRFDVDGAWLLSSDRIDAVLAPFVGPGRTIADIQQARAALEAAYARRGYGATQVVLPEQELKDGVVRLRVVEAKLSSIVLEGNRFFGYTNIRGSLPALQTGAPLDTDQLAANLALANENPAKQTTVVLKPGAREDEVEAQVRVADQRPYRFSLSVDNTGTPDTGNYRVGVGFQHANLFDRDQVLNLQYVTSPTEANDVLILGAGYHVPLYSLGDSIDLIAGYANVDSGVVQNLFNISGSGRIYAGRYNFGLPRFAGIEQKLSLGFDWRYYDNNVVPVGTSTAIVPDYVLHPLSLAYSGAWRGSADEVSFYASGVRNIPGGSNGNQAQFDLVRPGAPADYTLSRFNFVWVRSFPRDVQGRVRLTGQYTGDELVPAEQFGIGGLDSVRGFLERQFAGDRGYSGTFEVYSPDFGSRFEVEGLRVRVLAFYDYGRVWQINPQVFEPSVIGISSAGPGIRIAYKSNLSARFDYGFVIKNGGPGNPDHGRANFSLVWVF